MAETEGLPLVGIYVIAYMGKTLYVGKASQSVVMRLQSHWYRRDNEMLGSWLDGMQFDWANVRLDVLEPPDNVNQNYWLQEAESALIRKLKPLFNQQMNH